MTDPTPSRKDRRGGARDRSVVPPPGGPMNGRRMPLSLGYFAVAFIIILAIQYFVGQQGTKSIPYSELKGKIAAGEVASVKLGVQAVEAVPSDSTVIKSGVRSWKAERNGIEDDTLIRSWRR
jgi:hypothetical protein